MKIALVFPPSTFLTSPMVWMPLGLMYISTQLEALGHETEFFDLSEDELPDDGEYDQLWLSASAAQMSAVREIGSVTRNWEYTKTVFGGPAVWQAPNKYGDLPFDVLVAGEGDHPEVVNNILDLARFQRNYLYFTPLAKDLEWVLPPNRRWSKRYHAYITDQEGRKHRFSSLMTSRGCPQSCAFCSSGRKGVIWGDKVRYEPLWIVEKQLQEIEDLGFDGVTYYDDIFPLWKKRTLQILDMHQYYQLYWRCFMRSDIICKHGGKSYLKAMKDAGLVEVFLGVESASNVIKDNIHKGTTIEQDTAVLKWCKELGITCKTSFIIGLPGETRETMEETRSWILKNRPHLTQVDRLITFPGTPLTDHPDEYDLVYEETPDENWFFRGRHDFQSHSFVSTSSLSREEIDTFWRNLEQELIDEGLST